LSVEVESRGKLLDGEFYVEYFKERIIKFFSGNLWTTIIYVLLIRFPSTTLSGFEVIAQKWRSGKKF
jgi:hypothetical protein